MRPGKFLVTASDVPARHAGLWGRQAAWPPPPAAASATNAGSSARHSRPALFRRTLRLPGTARPVARLLLTLVLALLVAAVAPGFVPEPAWIERRVGDLGVPLPAGSGWVQTEREGDVWVASRVRRDLSGDARTLTLVLIEAQTVSAGFAQWPPEALAAQYLRWAIDDLTEDGVTTGRFSLIMVETTEVVRAGHRLHVMRNVKEFIDPWHPDLNREAQELYLLMLPDFNVRPTLYKILLTVDCFFEGCTAADLSLATLRPLLDGLRVYPAPSG